jgi:hypothetical protein
MKRTVFWHLSMMLSAYQEIPEFRDALLEKSRALLAFLRSNGLLASNRFDGWQGDEADFIIEESDLSSEGQRMFVEQHVGRWLGANDNINKPITIKRLESGLKKIRA